MKVMVCEQSVTMASPGRIVEHMVVVIVLYAVEHDVVLEILVQNSWSERVDVLTS